MVRVRLGFRVRTKQTKYDIFTDTFKHIYMLDNVICIICWFSYIRCCCFFVVLFC